MKYYRLFYSLLLAIFFMLSCKPNDSMFRAYGDYDLLLPTDTAGNKLTKSSRMYGFTSQKTNVIHQLTGKDFNVNFNLLVNTSNKTLNSGSKLYIDKALTKDTVGIIMDNLKIKSYNSSSSSSDIEVTFDRYFAVSMTTNTSTSTIIKQGSFKLKIAE